ncbi:hypothetical protein KFK09_026408 [Dendrobium nobile]|uniref:Uncharacterized protein n=1 Tax=Dendrobium nobile TaxID=94219 RepID=A0A8T3A8N2_DENNO|nr:hypothetical protein KFK09_026408 [Dendrobium nobile]
MISKPDQTHSRLLPCPTSSCCKPSVAKLLLYQNRVNSTSSLIHLLRYLVKLQTLGYRPSTFLHLSESSDLRARTNFHSLLRLLPDASHLIFMSSSTSSS